MSKQHPDIKFFWSWTRQNIFTFGYKNLSQKIKKSQFFCLFERYFPIRRYPDFIYSCIKRFLTNFMFTITTYEYLYLMSMSIFYILVLNMVTISCDYVLSSHQRCSMKKGVLRNFTKKNLAQVFSCEFCKISKRTSRGCFWRSSLTKLKDQIPKHSYVYHLSHNILGLYSAFRSDLPKLNITW